MKRLLLILLCLCMVVALFACGGEPPSSTQMAEDSEKIELNEANGVLYVNNEIIVFVRASASEDEIAALFDSFDAEVDASMADINVYRLVFKEAMTYDDLESLIKKIKSDPIVEDAYLNTVTEFEADATDPEDDYKYDSYAKVGGESIYVNYKDGRRDDTGASSIVFHSTATDLTILAYDTTGSFSGDHTGVLSMINDGRILKDIAIYSDADFNDYNTTYKINVKSSENATVNGIAMVKFTGSVKSTNDRDCYVYGYAFVVDGVPCVLAGFVLSEAQEQNLIASINIEVDAMIQTVRTER